jgi:hypothetical protein
VNDSRTLWPSSEFDRPLTAATASTPELIPDWSIRFRCTVEWPPDTGLAMEWRQLGRKYSFRLVSSFTRNHLDLPPVVPGSEWTL